MGCVGPTRSPNRLASDTTAHFQRSCEVHTSVGQKHETTILNIFLTVNYWSAFGNEASCLKVTHIKCITARESSNENSRFYYRNSWKSLVVMIHLPPPPSFFKYFQLGGSVTPQTLSIIDENVCLALGFLATIPLDRSSSRDTMNQPCLFICLCASHSRPLCLSFTVPTIKTEPHDDYELPRLCAPQHAPSLIKPYYALQAVPAIMPSENRACGTAAYSPQRLAAKPSSLSCSSSSPSTSPNLHDLSPTHFSPQCLSPGSNTGLQPSAITQVSTIQPTPGRYQQSALYPSGSASSSPGSHPSTPSSAPDLVFTPSHSFPDSQSPVTGEATELPKVPVRSGPSPLLQDEGAPATLAISIKQEPQELDQMYLDDGKSQSNTMSANCYQMQWFAFDPLRPVRKCWNYAFN